MDSHPVHGRSCQPVAPSYVREDLRGLFVEIVNEGPWETVIHGAMKRGAEMGNHYHRECRAFFYLVTGQAEVVVRHLVDNTTRHVPLHARQGMYFLPFQTHVIRYLEDSDFIFLKSYRYRDDEPDIYPCQVEP